MIEVSRTDFEKFVDKCKKIAIFIINFFFY